MSKENELELKFANRIVDHLNNLLVSSPSEVKAVVKHRTNGPEELTLLKLLNGVWRTGVRIVCEYEVDKHRVERFYVKEIIYSNTDELANDIAHHIPEFKLMTSVSADEVARVVLGVLGVTPTDIVDRDNALRVARAVIAGFTAK